MAETRERSLSMFAQLIDIEWLLSRHYFKPASVQRQYIWGVSQCETFHNDLLEAYGAGSDQQYYLGPVILAKDEKKDIVWVYDGQQRLTTLTIYMAALSQFASDDIQRKTSDLSKVRIDSGSRARIDLRTRGGALTRVVNGTHTRSSSLNMPCLLYTSPSPRD